MTAEMAAETEVGLLDVLKLYAEDVSATVAFYRDVLGAAVQQDTEHWGQVRLGGIDIGIHGGTNDPSAGWEPGFRVPDIAAFRAHLERYEVAVTRDFHDIPGGVTLSFRDPGGNSLAVTQYGTSEEELRS
jgi:predicted enzyme related to lactoylglutathione lyase